MKTKTWTRLSWQIQIEVVATFHMIFEIHMHILFIIEVKILVLTKWSYKFPLIRLTIKLRMVIVSGMSTFKKKFCTMNFNPKFGLGCLL